MLSSLPLSRFKLYISNISMHLSTNVTSHFRVTFRNHFFSGKKCFLSRLLLKRIHVYIVASSEIEQLFGPTLTSSKYLRGLIPSPSLPLKTRCSHMCQYMIRFGIIKKNDNRYK